MNKLNFSGHESFTCRQFWLKKVFDFASGGRDFAGEDAVIELGVGRNMVASIRYWGKAFGIINDDDSPTWLADYLFGLKGKDTYLEDFGSLWLLHYSLVKTNNASMYSLVFNEFRKERIDFTKEQLLNFCMRKVKEFNSNTDNKNTIERDVNIFLKSYVKPQKDEKYEIEDDYSGVLLDLDLIKYYRQSINDSMVQWYRLEGQDRIDLPYQIVLYAILDNFVGRETISFRELQAGFNSPGAVFALNEEGLYNKLQQIVHCYKNAVFTETAGDRILQFKKSLKPDDILNDYYG